MVSATEQQTVDNQGSIFSLRPRDQGLLLLQQRGEPLPVTQQPPGVLQRNQDQHRNRKQLRA